MSLIESIPFFKSKSPQIQQVVSESWSERRQVLLEDANLFVWERILEQPVKHFLTDVIQHDPDPIVSKIEAESVFQTIRTLRSGWDRLSTLDGDLFWQDVALLITDFLKLTKRSTGTMHLRVIDDNGCAKFHTDGYPLRLFTTYVGEGTEWIPEEASNRMALGTTNERIVKDQNKIHRLKEGHVGLLKGQKPNSSKLQQGIVHRSPPVLGAGEKRIILRVDI